MIVRPPVMSQPKWFCRSPMTALWVIGIERERSVHGLPAGRAFPVRRGGLRGGRRGGSQQSSLVNQRDGPAGSKSKDILAREAGRAFPATTLRPGGLISYRTVDPSGTSIRSNVVFVSGVRRARRRNTADGDDLRKFIWLFELRHGVGRKLFRQDHMKMGHASMPKHAHVKGHLRFPLSHSSRRTPSD
jgi:hypothetical protein